MNNKHIAHDQSKSSRGAAKAVPTDVEVLTLDELMKLAANFHMGLTNTKTSRADMNTVVQMIKQRASDELEVGDGIKFETVRVERKLDGSVSIFFGM